MARMPSLVVFAALLFAACGSKEPQAAAPPAANNPPASAAAVPSQAAPSTTPAQTAPPVQAAAVPQPATAALATEETTWPGVSADVTEFRRRGNTLTAKLRLTNRGSDKVTPEIRMNYTYVMDPAGAKKYEVLKDEKNYYISSLHTGYGDYWYQELKPGESTVIWMKFPAPPPEVKAVTLQVQGVPPFDDLQIQD